MRNRRAAVYVRGSKSAAGPGAPDYALGAHRALRWTIAMLAIALVMFGIQPPSAHAAAAYPEEAVKAIFLYRFAGYVTWPASTADAPQFTIAVLGADNVAEQLKEFLPRHPIQGRPARVAAIRGLSQLGDAQILYIGPDFAGKLSVLIEALKDRPILIVTDHAGALEEGSTVNFLLEEQHVRFEISTAAAKRSGLLIGSGLLAVAEHVKTSDVRGRAICRPFGENNPPCLPQLAAQINRLRYREGG
jgi:hypothetical protein